MNYLLTPAELDELLGYPRGRSARWARSGRLPHLRMPDGSLRFSRQAIEAWLAGLECEPQRLKVAQPEDDGNE